MPVYMFLIDDDDLIVYIIIVLHDCIARERICTKSLISLIKRYRRSSVHEVQEACYQFLELSQTLDHDKILDTNPDYQYWDQPIMANRDRPSNNRYPVQPADIEASSHRLAQNLYSSQSSRASSLGTMDNQGMSHRRYLSPKQTKYDHISSRGSSYDTYDSTSSSKEVLYDRSDMMSSLIDIEESGSRSLSSHSFDAVPSKVRPLKISTSQFGKLWLALPENEIKFQPANVFVTNMAKLAESILEDTGLWPIELIGEELIVAGDLAKKRPTLAHLRITESGDIECTVRSTRQVDSITLREIIDQHLI
ncbi:AP-4 complex subunit epsilon-1 [Umbelopsis sp. WA50703]